MASWLERVTGHGRIEVRDLTWLDCEFVALHLREIDRIELFGNLPTDNPLILVASVMEAVGRRGTAWCGAFDGRPAGVMGLFEKWAGNWEVFAFGTDAMRRVLVAFKPRFEVALAWAKAEGCRRLECKSHYAHTEAHGFLRLMGFEQEGVLRAYGKDGADYLAWSRLVG